MMRMLIGITIALSSPICLGSIGQKVEDWFSQQNYTNTTRPGVHEGQSARYMTFGGLSNRSEITYPFRFVQVQTPKFSAGCGGIDFYMGGISAIDADQFIENLTVIAQNAKGLAYMLAMQIVSPQIAGVIEDMQTFAQKYLNANMDSCEAATNLVGGSLELFGASEGNCTVKRMNETGEDWTKANYHCTTGGKRRQTEQSQPNRIDFVKGNLAWYALMQEGLFTRDTEFAELVMNITGTVIVTDAGSSDDSPSNIRIIPPVIKGDAKSQRFENIYKALLYGNDPALGPRHLQLYKCERATSNEYGCTKVSSAPSNVAVGWGGLFKKIDTLVGSIVRKIYEDLELTQEEKGLVSSTTIPLYRYLMASAAYFPRGVDISKLSNDYTRLIAEDILLRSLSAVVETAQLSASSLKGNISESPRVKAFRADLDEVMNGLATLQKKNDFDAKQFYEMQQRIQGYEKMLMSRLSSGFVSNAMWGK